MNGISFLFETAVRLLPKALYGLHRDAGCRQFVTGVCGAYPNVSWYGEFWFNPQISAHLDPAPKVDLNRSPEVRIVHEQMTFDCPLRVGSGLSPTTTLDPKRSVDSVQHTGPL